jgi:hypothetical protein
MNDELKERINLLLEDIKDAINECQAKLSDDEDIDWDEFDVDMENFMRDLRSYTTLNR